MATDTFDIGGDLTVNRLGFGAMRITGEDVIGEPADSENARAVLQRAVELGVDFVDTADSYGPGVSEYLRNAQLCSRDRLRMDPLDLYQLHRPDPDTPFEESVHTLAELKDEGLVRHVGLSNVSVDQLDRARDIVEIATVQNQYNVANRDSEAVLQACEDYDVGFIPWFPLAAGSVDDVDGIGDIAERHDATPHQIALAWLLHHSDVTLPIPGTADLAHLEQNVAAADIDLSDEEVATLT